ncbi:MAG: recombinase [Firmicutes bacterium HGW-Firmicutes-7]|nr:MAG: recombinase [Firmicutes bacterium HGW-Firmicutes-7]
MMKDVNRAALYCRLSKEDLDKEGKLDESQSIQNQKELLIEYATRNNIEIHEVYVDDDYSGFEGRPAFNSMIKAAKRLEFNIVLCKTQSRFTRDMESVEKYIHGLFPLLGIRFVGVVDNVDTKVPGNKKSRQINGLINEWYSEDLSENIRYVFKQKKEKGLFTGAFAPYGYKKDPQNKHKFLIDEPAAEVVRKIFDLYLEGYGYLQITDILTSEKIPTPTQYKKQKGFNFKNPNGAQFSDRYGVWGRTTIQSMLVNQVYIGHMVQCKEKKVSYKSKKTIKLPESEWIVVKNCHDPIINPEIFYRVKKLREANRKVCSSEEGNLAKAHVLASKVKCLDCTSNMSKSNNILRCQFAFKTRNKGCTSHIIKIDILHEIILDRINKLVNNYINESEDLDKLAKELSDKEGLKKEIISKESDLKNLEMKHNDIVNALSSLYIDKVKGIITENDFIFLKQNFDAELLNYQKAISKLKKQITLNENQANKKIDVGKLLSKHKDLTVLTREMADDFIDYIEVGQKDEIDNQEVVIHWNI